MRGKVSWSVVLEVVGLVLLESRRFGGRAMDVRFDADEYAHEEIGSKIARGLAQLEDGQGIDGEEFFERLRRRGENLRSPRR